jgi:hypothetical protein
MALVEEDVFRMREDDYNAYVSALEEYTTELRESVRHYFSAENMPSDEERRKAATEYVENRKDDVSTSVMVGFNAGARWALERLKWKT